MLMRNGAINENDYQREVNKGKSSALANFEKLDFRASALRRNKGEDYGLIVFIYWGRNLC